jgi:redox-sensitive bicupin YhaK (pirin superfamily)
MSWQTDTDPKPGDAISSGVIEMVILPRTRDLGGFEVRRALPSSRRQMVGPFIFVDQMGPAVFGAGQGISVRPHPHINLATVTYLFEGEILHRDSLGSLQPIRPGEVNWMTAGRGIVHSERTGPEARARGGTVSGLQTWVALPADAEETDPAFAHHGAAELPLIADADKTVRLIAGSLYGRTSPARTLSDLFYADAILKAGALLPLDAEHEERAIYTVAGDITIARQSFGPGQLLVLRPGDRITIEAKTAARFMLLGGATMDGPRYIWWNFVSSRKERIEQASAEWKAGRFAKVPGDEKEFIPLPDQPSVPLYP